MLARLPRLIIVRLLGALLLATVGLQAGAPMAAPLERVHGSAFSANTHEVALAAARRAEPARQAIAPQPLLQPTAPQITIALPQVAEARSGAAPRPDSTGPPPPDMLALRPAPRAPPHA